MCKGAEDLRPSNGDSPQAYSEVEQFIAKMELKLNIQDINYDIFERCIKRFGYAVDLTDDCWRATVAETRVDVAAFKEHGNMQHSYFQHKKLFNGGRYEAKKVLYIAFLHCKHQKRAIQERSLWGIINPKLDDFIKHEQADEFFDDLALIAIDLPLKHCQSWMKGEIKKK